MNSLISNPSPTFLQNTFAGSKGTDHFGWSWWWCLCLGCWARRSWWSCGSKGSSCLGGTCGWWCKSCTKGRILDVDDKQIKPHSTVFLFRISRHLQYELFLLFASGNLKNDTDVRCVFSHFFSPAGNVAWQLSQRGGLIWFSEVSIRYTIIVPEANVAPENGWLEY